MSYIEGVEVVEEDLYGCQVTTVHVQTEQAAQQINKAVGSYITIESDEVFSENTEIENIGECLAEVLDRVLRPHYNGKLCVCGLGKRALPVDALGPEVTQNLPLRLFSDIGAEGNFRDVCSIEPGTEYSNNIKTEAIVNGVVKEIGADCILLVDSVVTKDPDRLFRTIQISTAGGTTPYLYSRKADWSALGIPVISLGVPVSIPLSALSQNQCMDRELFTSTRIDSVIAAAGRLIAYAILRVCWPSQSKADCFILSGLNKDPVPYSFLAEEKPETAKPAR